MTALGAWILSDGKPGHVNQSRGLLRWLGGCFDLRAEELRIGLAARPLARRLLPPLVNGGYAARGALRMVRGAHPLPAPAADAAPDLIVSAGGDTAAANVLLARRFRCPNLFLGSIRRFAPQGFTAHLTLEPQPDAANIVMNVSPNPLSAAQIAARGRDFLRRIEPGGGPLWLMACGGDGAGIRYGAGDWRRLGAWMSAASERFGCRWLVSTSRRTGAGAEDALRDALDPARVAYAVWWSRRPERILSALMGAAERIFVTADSMAMIGECIGADKGVVAVHGGAGRPDRRYLDALAKYERLGVCRNAPLSAPAPAPQATPGPAIDSLIAPQVEELRRRIARALEARRRSDRLRR